MLRRGSATNLVTYAGHSFLLSSRRLVHIKLGTHLGTQRQFDVRASLGQEVVVYWDVASVCLSARTMPRSSTASGLPYMGASYGDCSQSSLSLRCLSPSRQVPPFIHALFRRRQPRRMLMIAHDDEHTRSSDGTLAQIHQCREELQSLGKVSSSLADVYLAQCLADKSKSPPWPHTSPPPSPLPSRPPMPRSFELFAERMADELRNYSCADSTRETTEALRSYSTLPDKLSGVFQDVSVLLDAPNAQILHLRNFVSPSECEAVRSQVLSTFTDGLPRAMVEDSLTRKPVRDPYRVAYNGGVDPTLFNQEHTIRRVAQRALDLTAEQMPFISIGSLEGQEPLGFIQYTDQGDEYRAHCDGSCDGSSYRNGGRVATVIMYCRVAEVGGGTTFSKSNVFVKPSVGDAVFFSYVGADGWTDFGLTEHSGCPVHRGEKWVLTQWIRQGVSASVTHKNFDALGNWVSPPPE